MALKYHCPRHKVKCVGVFFLYMFGTLCTPIHPNCATEEINSQAVDIDKLVLDLLFFGIFR